MLPTLAGKASLMFNNLCVGQYFYTGGQNQYIIASDWGTVEKYPSLLVSGMACESSEAIAPLWFAPVQQQLNRMEASLAALKSAGNGDGNVYPLSIVLFNDGTNPTATPHNLPALTSVAVINTLSAFDCNRYLTGYGVPHVPGQSNVAARRRLVKISIGCRSI